MFMVLQILLWLWWRRTLYIGRIIFPGDWLNNGANHKTEPDDDLFKCNTSVRNKLNNVIIINL